MGLADGVGGRIVLSALQEVVKIVLVERQALDKVSD